MKYYFVGDLQEGLQYLDRILLLQGKDSQVIFLGDILDSYRYKSVEHIAALDKILESDAILLDANHEWSYMHPRMKCSGWRPDIAAALLTRKSRLLDKQQAVFRVPNTNIVATHAGITEQFWTGFGISLGNVEEICREAKRDIDSWFFAIGNCRGGSSPWGGPIWCDWYQEFQPVKGVIQIVGHSRPRLESCLWGSENYVGGLRQSINGDWCIDVLGESPTILEVNEKGYAIPYSIATEG